MRIALTGASSTGKTTLAQALATELDITYHGSTARQLAKEWKLQPEQFKDAELSIKFQEEVISRKYREESNLVDFITDRALIDSAAYVLKLHHIYNDVHYEFIHNYIKKCIDITNELYDIVIRLPANVIPVEIDNERVTNRVSNTCVDWINKGLFTQVTTTKYEIPPEVIKEGVESTVYHILELPGVAAFLK